MFFWRARFSDACYNYGVFKHILKTSYSTKERYKQKHRLEHWYVDNQVYFITARCRDKFPAFATEQAKAVFWNRFDSYTSKHLFTPWVTTLLDNHYHVFGYCKTGTLMGEMMQRIHGSVAKLVNDTLQERRVPFWTQRGKGHSDYFDGCIRDEKQCRLAYRYTLTQSVRHGVCSNWRDYPHTHVNIEFERGLRRALELGAFMEDVPYQRYKRTQKNMRR